MQLAKSASLIGVLSASLLCALLFELPMHVTSCILTLSYCLLLFFVLNRKEILNEVHCLIHLVKYIGISYIALLELLLNEFGVLPGNI